MSLLIVGNVDAHGRTRLWAHTCQKACAGPLNKEIPAVIAFNGLVWKQLDDANCNIFLTPWSLDSLWKYKAMTISISSLCDCSGSQRVPAL
jgi:hypothetical protein